MNLKYKKAGQDPTSPSQHLSGNVNNSVVLNSNTVHGKKDLKRLISGGGGAAQASTRVTYIDLCSNPVSGNMVVQQPAAGQGHQSSTPATNLSLVKVPTFHRQGSSDKYLASQQEH